MSDAIKPPGAGSTDDAAKRPDMGFHDDHVGSHLKAEEAAKRRAAQGVAQRRPKRLEVEPRQVGAVRQNRATTQDERAAEDRKRQQRGLVAGKGPSRPQPTRNEAPTAAVEQDVRRLEGRIDLLLVTLRDLEAELATAQARAADEAAAEAAQQSERVHRRQEDPSREREQRGRPTPDKPEAEAEAEAKGENSAEFRWQKTARDMRFLLQHLIAGGVGLTLSADPAITFAPLFAKLAAWPSRVPPGRIPENDADYDALLQWIFRPEEGHERAEEEQRATPF